MLSNFHLHKQKVFQFLVFGFSLSNKQKIRIISENYLWELIYFLWSLLSGIFSKWVIFDFSVCIIEALKINNEKRSINCLSDFFFKFEQYQKMIWAHLCEFFKIPLAIILRKLWDMFEFQVCIDESLKMEVTFLSSLMIMKKKT